MKSMYYEAYGTPLDVISVRDVPKPTPKEDEVLIRVKAVSLNASDLEYIKAEPGYVRIWGPFKPRKHCMGSDIAGVVESVGAKVSAFKSGDEVFCDALFVWGGCAEYVVIPAKLLAHKPSGLSFEDAAALPQAGVVAMQGIESAGDIDGKSILIIGAGGGSGSFAIQFAKQAGAKVTGIDRADKASFMKDLGADKTIDFKTEDVLKLGEKYDFILDFICKRNPLSYKKILNSGGRYKIVGGYFRYLLTAGILGSLTSWGSRKIGMFIHKPNTDELTRIAQKVIDKSLKVCMDKSFSLDEVASAFDYLSSGAVTGKIVMRVEE